MRLIGTIIRAKPTRGGTIGVIRATRYLRSDGGWVYAVQPLYFGDPYAAMGDIAEADIEPGEIAYPTFTVGQVLTVNNYPAIIEAVDTESFPQTLTMRQEIESLNRIKLVRNYNWGAHQVLAENPTLIQGTP